MPGAGKVQPVGLAVLVPQMAMSVSTLPCSIDQHGTTNVLLPSSFAKVICRA